jgi:lipoprotein-anchoring transpeptidase ErfK/SrfK
VDAVRTSSRTLRVVVGAVVVVGSILLAIPLAAARSPREVRVEPRAVPTHVMALNFAFAPTSRDLTLIVTPLNGGGLSVHAAPDATSPTQALPAVNELGSPLVLLSKHQEDGWLEVLLPTRPNGASGWVQTAEVNTAAPEYEVVVSRSAHELRVVRRADGAVVMTSIVGVGAPSRPTPAGQFFVRDHFPTSGANHPYGPFAFGLSGHSEVLSEFGTGDGRIAIHGTNEPATIGADASNGCVHVPNDVVLALIPYLPLGTPVTIT